MRAATSTMTARLIAEWDVIHWLASHRLSARTAGLWRYSPTPRTWPTRLATALLPPQQRVPGDTWPACRAARVAQYAHQQPHWPPREPTPHSTLTTCCKPRRHTCGPAGRRVDERISPGTCLCREHA